MGEMTGETTGEQGSRRTGGRRGAARAGLGLVVSVGAALLLAACGGGEAGGDEAKTGSSAKPSATAPSEAGKQDAKLATRTTKLGKVLTDGRGHTLYTFDKDTAKTSACTGKCAALWPPVTGTPQAGAGLPKDAGTLERPDGATQATYDGHALYRFAKDTAPGKTAGDGVKGVWHAVVIEPAADGAS
ncbi:COG4315 family predicted lipoprotein [Streptomyces purpurogeneiscleroticus]|uniref:COG4315 family predicted lipoprotein n=1 Tax=Streptomyces purpurogeneiscleroticus TaxID=68259 RepID=UPI001CBFFCF5|nr:hypothetical protein [Streptomyces purpurogeneiscleroticus]